MYAVDVIVLRDFIADVGNILGSQWVFGTHIPFVANALHQSPMLGIEASGLEEKVINNIFVKFAKAKDRWFEFIDQSFLPNEMKEAFKIIIAQRLSLLA